MRTDTTRDEIGQPLSDAEIQATALGLADRELYLDEFGERPAPETCGDWDSTAWAEVWAAVTRDHDNADAECCLAAWRRGFFAV